MPISPAIAGTPASAPEGAPQDGPWVQHDKAGTLRTKAKLQQGLLHGPLSLFDEHGRLSLEEHHVHGKVEGVRRIYVEGKLHTVAQYRDGRQQGETHLHHTTTGRLAATLPFHEGRLHGQAAYFDQEGNLARTTSYEEGKRHGETISYYPDGTRMSMEPYTYDLLDGEAKWFSPQGELVKNIMFVQGKPASDVPAPAPAEPALSTAPRRTLTIKPR